MKKTFSIISALIISSIICSAQGKIENYGNDIIVLNAHISKQQTDIPIYAQNILFNKLNTIASLNGMGGGGFDPRFIITPNITILAKEISPTAPPMISLKLNISLYIGDGITGTLFSTTSMEAIGVGTNDTKAYISALKKLNPSHPSIKAFVEMGKTKILNYFNNQCDRMLKRVETLESQNRFQEAIVELTSVPSASVDCYNKSAKKIERIYQKHINKECKSEMILAQNAWNSGQDYESALEAGSFLSRIDPASSCYKEAVSLSQTIGKRMEALDQREWDFKLKEAEDDLNLKRDLTQAARDAAVSFGENQPAVEYKTEEWY